MKSVLPALAAALAILAAPAARAETLLAVFAHPDDELTVAPLLAKYAREGHAVHIAYATSGDRGPGVSGMQPGAQLGAVRENEARCAAKALDLDTINFAGFGDGTLGAATDPPGAPLSQLAVKVGQLINAIRPDTILTWGPDGGYGHPDHRLVSAVVTQAIQASGPAAPRLVYPGIAAVDPAALPPQFANWATTHPGRLNISVAYTDADLAAAASAFQCHETQFPANYRQGAPALLHRSVWRGRISLRDAFPRPASASLFEGK